LWPTRGDAPRGLLNPDGRLTTESIAYDALRDPWKGTRMPDRFSLSDWAITERQADQELVAWIVALRGRLAAGEFSSHPPLELGYGTGQWPAERTLRIMLADLDHYTTLAPTQRLDPRTASRRLSLLDDFRVLRELVG
jgi:hypothetical protein